jgi:hypothetical protein
MRYVRIACWIVLFLVVIACAREPLTNESIVKLVKAGLGEDMIVSMVNTQPAKYSLSADDIIAVKRDCDFSSVATRKGPLAPTGGTHSAGIDDHSGVCGASRWPRSIRTALALDERSATESSRLLQRWALRRSDLGWRV